MPNFTVYKTHTGEIVGTGSMATEEWALAQAGEGESVLLGSARFDQRIVDGVPVDLPPRPDDDQVFDYVLGRWFDPRSLVQMRAGLKEVVAARRFEVETRGIRVSAGMPPGALALMPAGIPVATDRESRAALAQLISDLTDAGLATADYKTAAGFVTLTVAQLRGIAVAVTLHVQSCFTAERKHVDAIDALRRIENAKSYDTEAFWPP